MEPGHIQLNYRQGGKYKVMVEGLRVRTKKATQDTICLLDADIIGGMEKGAQVTNHATARVGDQIWMYIGQDCKGREQWLCADNGNKIYIG